MLIAEMGAHFLPHFPHFGLQRRPFTRRAEDIASDGIKTLLQRRIAIDYAGTHQGLMFPGPGLILLVVGKRIGSGDQHTRRTRRT